MKIGSMQARYFPGIIFAYMGIITYSQHVRYEVSKKEDGFLIRIPRRKYSIFKPPVLIQFQDTADILSIAGGCRDEKHTPQTSASVCH
jgi:hypothetical protein